MRGEHGRDPAEPVRPAKNPERFSVNRAVSGETVLYPGRTRCIRKQRDASGESELCPRESSCVRRRRAVFWGFRDVRTCNGLYPRDIVADPETPGRRLEISARLPRHRFDSGGERLGSRDNGSDPERAARIPRHRHVAGGNRRESTRIGASPSATGRSLGMHGVVAGFKLDLLDNVSISRETRRFLRIRPVVPGARRVAAGYKPAPRGIAAFPAEIRRIPEIRGDSRCQRTVFERNRAVAAGFKLSSRGLRRFLRSHDVVSPIRAVSGGSTAPSADSAARRGRTRLCSLRRVAGSRDKRG